MADDVNIVNYGYGGVASEETLRDLLEAVKAMSAKAGKDASEQVKKVSDVFNKALKASTDKITENTGSTTQNTTATDKNTDSVKSNTTEFDKLSDTVKSANETVSEVKDVFDVLGAQTLKSFTNTVDGVIGSMGTLVGSINGSIEKLNDFSSQLGNAGSQGGDQSLNNILDSLLGNSNNQGGSSGGGDSFSNILDSLLNRIGDLDDSIGDLSDRINDVDVDRTTSNALNQQRSGLRIFAMAVTAVGSSLFTLGESLLFSANNFEDLASSIPVVGSLIGKLAKFMDGLVDNFRVLTNVGIDLGSSLYDFRQAAAESGLSLQTFTDIVRYNNESFALFAGGATAGAKVFRDVSKIVQMEFGQTFSNLGLTMEETAQYTADYLEMQRRLGNNQRFTDRQLADGTQNYIMMLDRLSKLTGKQRDMIAKDLEDQRLDVAFSSMLSSLDPKMAENVQEAISRTPAALQQGIQDYFTTGGPFTEAAAQFQNALLMLGVAPDEISSVISGLKQGTIDADAMSAIYSKAANTAANMDRTTFEMIAARSGVNSELARMVVGMIGYTNIVVDSSEALRQQANAQNRAASSLVDFERRITEFRNTIVNSLIESGIMYKLENAMEGVVDFLTNPRTLGALSEFIDTISGAFSGTDTWGKFFDVVKGGFMEMIDDIKRYIFGETAEEARARTLSEKTSAEERKQKAKTDLNALMAPTQNQQYQDFLSAINANANINDDLKSAFKEGTLSADMAGIIATELSSTGMDVSRSDIRRASQEGAFAQLEEQVGDLGVFFNEFTENGRINQQALNARFQDDQMGLTVARDFLSERLTIANRMESAQKDFDAAQQAIIKGFEDTPGIINDTVIPAIADGIRELLPSKWVIGTIAAGFAALLTAPAVITALASGAAAATAGAGLLARAGSGAAALGRGALTLGRGALAAGGALGSAPVVAGAAVLAGGVAATQSTRNAANDMQEVEARVREIEREQGSEEAARYLLNALDEIEENRKIATGLYKVANVFGFGPNFDEVRQNLLDQYGPGILEGRPDTSMASTSVTDTNFRTDESIPAMRDARIDLETEALDKNTTALKDVSTTIQALTQSLEQRLNTNINTPTTDTGDVIEKLQESLQNISIALTQMKEIDAKIERNTRAIGGNYAKTGYGR